MGMATARERDVAKAVAEEVRAIMARRQIKRLHLSRSSGIANSTLTYLLDGESAMDLDQYARICRALELDPGELLTLALARLTSNGLTDPSPEIVNAVLDAETGLTERQKDSLRPTSHTDSSHSVRASDTRRTRRIQ